MLQLACTKKLGGIKLFFCFVFLDFDLCTSGKLIERIKGLKGLHIKLALQATEMSLFTGC